MHDAGFHDVFDSLLTGCACFVDPQMKVSFLLIFVCSVSANTFDVGIAQEKIVGSTDTYWVLKHMSDDGPSGCSAKGRCVYFNSSETSSEFGVDDSTRSQPMIPVKDGFCFLSGYHVHNM